MAQQLSLLPSGGTEARKYHEFQRAMVVQV